MAKNSLLKEPFDLFLHHDTEIDGGVQYLKTEPNICWNSHSSHMIEVNHELHHVVQGPNFVHTHRHEHHEDEWNRESVDH